MPPRSLSCASRSLRPETGARDQSFRLIVQPDLWGKRIRIHLSNAFGNRLVTFDGVHVGLHLGGGALVHATNRPVQFAGKPSITVAPGGSAWSDAVDLPFFKDAAVTALAGRKLAVSFHIAAKAAA